MEIHDTSVKIRLYIKRFQDTHSVYHTNIKSVYLTWKAHMKDFVKINCDGAWNSYGSSAGVGVICRDHHKVVIASLSVAFNNVSGCLDAEGLALKQGMLLAKELYGLELPQVNQLKSLGAGSAMKSYLNILSGR